MCPQCLGCSGMFMYKFCQPDLLLSCLKKLAVVVHSAVESEEEITGNRKHVLFQTLGRRSSLISTLQFGSNPWNAQCLLRHPGLSWHCVCCTGALEACKSSCWNGSHFRLCSHSYFASQGCMMTLLQFAKTGNVHLCSQKWEAENWKGGMVNLQITLVTSPLRWLLLPLGSPLTCILPVQGSSQLLERLWVFGKGWQHHNIC